MNDYLPTLTVLQIVMLVAIRLNGPVSGRMLRARLTERNITISGPAFYQFMARLCDAGLVIVDRKIEPQGRLAVKETYYSISEKGIDMSQAALDFYERLSTELNSQVEETHMVG